MSKTVIITGASSGIGLAAAEHFLREGVAVFGLDIVEPGNSGINYIHCDVASIEAINDAVSVVQSEVGVIDYAVSNAGVHFSATIEQTSEQDFDRLVDVNFKSSFFFLKAVLPIMKAQGHGKLVMVASDQAFIGKRSSAIYGATKAAIAQLTKSTALDYADHNIQVNAVCPGTVNTPLYQHAIAAYSDRSGIAMEEIEVEEAACQPMNQVGKPEAVADLIYFLTQVDFATGGLYPIDGGYTAR